MKLMAINSLCIEDLKVMDLLLSGRGDVLLEEDDEGEGEDKGEGEKKEGGEKEEPVGPGPGTKKNEGSPAAKAYGGSGMSQQEISNKTGISKAEISKYKSSEPEIHRDPSVKSLEKLAKAGVNVRQMLPQVFK